MRLRALAVGLPAQLDPATLGQSAVRISANTLALSGLHHLLRN
jgi:hypothetical protein